MKAFSNIFLMAVAIIVTVTSCRKFVELEPPATQLVGSEVFNSDATATSAMSNVYMQCSNSNFASGGPSGMSVICGLAADEFDVYNTNDAVAQVFKNIIQPNNSFVSPLWSGLYSVIYQSNSIIERLGTGTNLSKGVKDQLTGEALFMRAFAHFYLTGLYGDVPYVTSTDYRINRVVVQQKRTDVLASIIADLKSAKPLLADNYGFTSQERVRPNKWAASALMARVYLNAGEWSKAESEATLVLEQKSLYGLTALDGVFLKNSKEAIWQLKPVSTTLNTNDGNLYILTAKPSNYALRAGFLEGFEANDLRRQSWVGTFSNSGGSWNFPYKYKIKTGASPLNEYSMVLRLAEQYLIRAEARMQLGKLADAISDLDEIRFRAGLLKLANTNSGIDKEALGLAIEQERRVELFSEWGHRWFDLKRTGRIDVVFSAKKVGWKSSASLFPIPASEILLNGNLKQNGGYQQ